MKKYDVMKLSELSKLSFDENELSEIEKDMENIIELMDNIRKTEAVFVADFENTHSCMREDIVKNGLDENDFDKLCIENGFFCVSKVF